MLKCFDIVAYVKDECDLICEYCRMDEEEYLMPIFAGEEFTDKQNCSICGEELDLNYL